MTLRASERTVTFSRPFVLEERGEVLPPGRYVVETVEEQMKDVSFLAYRRLMTLLHMPSSAPNTPMARSLQVDPAKLEAALRRDAGPPADDGSDPDCRPPSAAACRQSADTRARERAENEGMRPGPAPDAAPETAPPRQRELEQQRPQRRVKAATGG